MNTRPATLTTLVTIARCIAETLRREYQMEPGPMLAGFGIDEQALGDGELRMPLDVFSKLWAAAAELSGDPAFGMRAVAHFHSVDCYGLDLVMQDSLTLGDAVRRRSEFGPLLSTVSRHTLRQDSAANWRLEFEVPKGFSATPYARDFALACHAQAFERQFGVALQDFLVEVQFTGPEVGAVQAWHELGVKVRYNQPFTALVFSRFYWNTRSWGGDASLVSCLELPLLQQLVRLGISVPLSTLKARLVDQLQDAPDTVCLARSLGLDVEQVSHSLALHGLSFNQLLDQARHMAALRLLAQPDLALDQIAQRLGMSKASSLIRALHRWEGMTPKHWRNLQRQTVFPIAV